MEKFLIDEYDAKQRIDKFIRKNLNNTPLSMIYKLFRKKDIKVNGKPVKEDYLLDIGDEVTIYLPIEKEKFIIEKEYRPVKPSFKIVYEDENILMVNKSKGILVHNAENKGMSTLTDQVITYLVQKGEYDPKKLGFTPAPAHRLDRNTSGLVLYGKNMQALQELNEAFKNKEQIQKYYLVLVAGKIKEEGIIDKRLLKNEDNKMVRVVKEGGQSALTIYRPLKVSSNYSLVEAELKTGRTHQIRVHFASINHPVIGDKKYGDFKTNAEFKKHFEWEDQFLHAYKVTFKDFEYLSYLNNKTFKAELDNQKAKIIKEIFKD